MPGDRGRGASGPCVDPPERCMGQRWLEGCPLWDCEGSMFFLVTNGLRRSQERAYPFVANRPLLSGGEGWV